MAAPATPAASLVATLPPIVEPRRPPAMAPTAVPVFSLAPWPVSGVAAHPQTLPAISKTTATLAGNIPSSADRRANPGHPPPHRQFAATGDQQKVRNGAKARPINKFNGLRLAAGTSGTLNLRGDGVP